MAKPITLESGEKITPRRIYGLRGVRRQLIVTEDRCVWLDHDGRYTLLAAKSDWDRRCGEAAINRASAFLAANLGEDA